VISQNDVVVVVDIYVYNKLNKI